MLVVFTSFLSMYISHLRAENEKERHALRMCAWPECEKEIEERQYYWFDQKKTDNLPKFCWAHSRMNSANYEAQKNREPAPFPQ